jgi:3-phenylpropionate/trans-cinnamate dioxygenase ferredoxin component
MSEAVAGVWLDACGIDEVELEDLIECEVAGRALAIYRSPADTFHATDGICTHEQAHLADGLVFGDLIECPKHGGRFNYKTGEAKRLPACIDLRSYPVRVEAGRVVVCLPSDA